ncbi:MAG: AAA domain-containing protein [Chloroflexi bacterium]|nr:AAA domain-containing protein [Chloroflexota bacterium]
MVDGNAKMRMIIDNVSRVLIGKRREVELAVVALASEGHILVEDVPGVGKTMLAKSLAKSIGCTFRRIQFTPDLLPSDVTGVSIYNQKTEEFEFRPGPIVAQIVLADEINRATPKTQSALLESMEERHLTVDGVTHWLPEPFMVMATQNPIEYEGTFPLPEAQLDRFIMRIRLGYPSQSEEVAVLDSQVLSHPIDAIEQVVDGQDLIEIHRLVRQVRVDPFIRRYIVEIVAATRSHPEAYLGASPRGSLSLFRTAQASALVSGKDYVIPDDVKALAESVLSHRVIMNPAARVRNVQSTAVVQEVLRSVPVPGARVPV